MAQPVTGMHTTPPVPITPALGPTTPALDSTITTQGNTPLVPIAMRSYNLDKLTDPNYLTRMTLMLKRADLSDIVRGATQPSTTNNANWIAKDL
jgi:hypothetical protein